MQALPCRLCLLTHAVAQTGRGSRTTYAWALFADLCVWQARVAKESSVAFILIVCVSESLVSLLLVQDRRTCRPSDCMLRSAQRMTHGLAWLVPTHLFPLH